MKELDVKGGNDFDIVDKITASGFEQQETKLLTTHSYSADAQDRIEILTAVVDELAAFFRVSKVSANTVSLI